MALPIMVNRYLGTYFCTTTPLWVLCSRRCVFLERNLSNITIPILQIKAFKIQHTKSLDAVGPRLDDFGYQLAITMLCAP